MPHTAATATTPAATAITTDQLRSHWQGHRALSRRVIEAFPEDQLFSFSVGGMRPFGELAREMLNMTIPIVRGAATGAWEAYGKASQPDTKEGILARWDADTAELDELWSGVTSERLQTREIAFDTYDDTVLGHVLYGIDNEIHHRGQGYVYLRALGIEPPPFWER